jgi:hypothetical protein
MLQKTNTEHIKIISSFTMIGTEPRYHLVPLGVIFCNRLINPIYDLFKLVQCFDSLPSVRD